MKYFTLLAAALLLFSSCDRDDDAGPAPSSSSTNAGVTPISGTAWVIVDPNFDEQVKDLAVYDNSIWLAYSKYDSGLGFSYTGVYNGTTIANLFQPNIGTGTGIDELYVYNDGFYARGALDFYGVFEYNSADERWDTKYQTPGATVNVYGFTQYQGNNVITTGNLPFIFMDNNGTLTPVGNGTNGFVSDVIEYNGELIAAGNFS
ncbi:MAG: hypothetical protein ACFB10_12460, partial [Salibacteraceae bacterium]